jgi:hypothetical protein
MGSPAPYVAIAIAALAVVAVLAFLLGKKKAGKRLTPLSGLAFGFVLAGILFGDNRNVGYGLMGVGVLLAFVDIIQRSRGR